MSKPNRPTQTQQSTYPTLNQFMSDRRRFLQELFVGSAALSVVAACGPGEPPPRRLPADAGVDPNANPPPLGGGAPAPDFIQFRLPDPGTAHTYLRDGSYLAFAVVVLTYDESFAAYYRANQRAGLDASARAMASSTCDELATEEGVTAAEAAIRQALDRAYAEANGYGAQGSWAQAADLQVVSCETQVALPGDVAEPQYPDAGQPETDGGTAPDGGRPL